MNLAIIGAGIAGLACAEAALRNGHKVTLFDKGRGAGGRLSTRRADHGENQLYFDHGTPGFTAESEAFKSVIEAWVRNACVARWTPNTVRLSPESQHALSKPEMFVGTPGMNGLVKALAQDKSVHFGRRVTAITKSPELWSIHSGPNEDAFTCDGVVLAIPNEQAVELLTPIRSDLTDRISSCHALPVWSLMLAFDTPLNLGFDLAECDASPLARIIRNQTKPGRTGNVDCLVLQATTDWSQTHLEDTPEMIEQQLIGAATELIGPFSEEPVFARAHRWRYALNAHPFGQPHIYDEVGKIGICGDWLLGKGVEKAWTSGTELGERL